MIRGFLRLGWRISLGTYFRRIDADGVAHVPARGPVLLVPNHANALVDPLIIQTRLARPISR